MLTGLPAVSRRVVGECEWFCNEVKLDAMPESAAPLLLLAVVLGLCAWGLLSSQAILQHFGGQTHKDTLNYALSNQGIKLLACC